MSAQDWAEFATGESGNIETERNYLQALQKMYKLFIRKNHDYGSNNLSTGWVRGVAIRMGDKISRLWTLYGLDTLQEAPVTPKITSETREDSLLDIANYGVVGFLMETGNWPRGSVHDLYGKKALGKLLARIYGDLDDDSQQEILEVILASEIARDLKAKVVLDS